jgi:hypothetical protein
MLGRVQGELLVVERLAAGVPGYEQLSQEIERLRAALEGRAPAPAAAPEVKPREPQN